MNRKPGSIVHLKNIISRNLYRLKWRYGVPVDHYTDAFAAFDPESGRTTITPTKYHIDRAILLPGLVHRNIFQSISFVKANSNFVLGGDVDLRDRQFLIDARDLPYNYKMKINSYLMYGNKRYDIIKLEELEEQTGYFLMCRNIENAHNLEIIDEKMFQRLTPSSSFTSV